MKKLITICLTVVVMSVGNVNASFIGVLSTADGGLSGTGVWMQGNGSSLSWNITQEGTVWHYEYNLIVPEKNISHMIIEVSDNFTREDILNSSWDSIEIGNFSSSNGNPGMPGSIYGIKFAETSGVNLIVQFDSYRMPVWGDFYSKDGQSTGTWNALWNSGFTDTDPLISAHNGSESNHLLVPDTIPEPATVCILGLGALSLLKRKSSK